MPWSAITAADFLSQLSQPELELVRASALAPGQDDPVPQVLARVTSEVRGYIPALRTDARVASGQLPEALHAAALDIARVRLISRLAAGKASAYLLTDARQRAYEAALALLRDCGRGVFVVEPPPTSSAPAPTATSEDAGAWGSEEVIRP